VLEETAQQPLASSNLIFIYTIPQNYIFSCFCSPDSGSCLIYHPSLAPAQFLSLRAKRSNLITLPQDCFG